jgi:hypothetical protein
MEQTAKQGTEYGYQYNKRQEEAGLDHKAEDGPDHQGRGQVRLSVDDEPERRPMNGPGR